MKSFTVSQLMSIIIKIHIFQDAKGKTLIRNNTRGYATAKRGARFHPTIGLATPSGFTTSHPRAETTMLWDCVSVRQWPGVKVAILPLCYHSLCVFPEFSPRVCPQSLLPHALSSCEVECGVITLVLIRPDGSTDGRFTSHPSLNHLPTSLQDI